MVHVMPATVMLAGGEPGTSLAITEIVISVSSAVTTASSFAPGSRSATSSVKVSVTVRPVESVTVRSKSAVPNRFVPRLIVTVVGEPDVESMRPGVDSLFSANVGVKLSPSQYRSGSSKWSASVIVTTVFSIVLIVPIGLDTNGSSGIGVTSTLKVSVATWAPLSVAWMVTLTEPFASGARVNCMLLPKNAAGAKIGSALPEMKL